MIVGLPELKRHLRIELDVDEEDQLIASYGEAAATRVMQWIGRPVYATAAEMLQEGEPGYDRFQMVADQAIRVAIMKMVAQMYGPERAGNGAPDDDAVPSRDIRDLLSGHRIMFRDIEITLVPR